MTASWNGRRLLVVVAHPDDETFGCGSVIADAAAGGAQVTVCCATRGEAGEPAPGCDLGTATLADVRVRELHEAGTALGATEIVLLDFVDSGMSGDAAEATLVGAPFDAVVEAVRAVITKVDPDVVVTLDDTGADGHRDHVRIALATIEAVRRMERKPRVYAWCIVRSLLTRWIEELHRSNPEAGHLQLDTAELGRPDHDVTTVLSVGRHMDRRRAAIALHRSQRSPYEDMPADLVAAFLEEDRFVRIEPPWTGGPVETSLLPTAG